MSGQTAEKAEIGDLVHDLGEDHEVGWFIVGEGGHWDVDNACWTEATEDDAPWTSEHFEIFGPVPALVTYLAESAIRYTTLRDDSRYGIRDEVEWDCSRCGTVKGEEWEPQIVRIREVTYYAPTDQPEEVRCGGEEESDV